MEETKETIQDLAAAIEEANLEEICSQMDFGANPLDLEPTIMNKALNDQNIFQQILRKLPTSSEKQKWISHYQKYRAKKEGEKQVEEEEDIQPTCLDAELPPGLPDECFSWLGDSVNATDAYKICGNILLLIPSQGAGEADLICTSIQGLTSAMEDQNRIRYECTSNTAFLTKEDPDPCLTEAGLPCDRPGCELYQPSRLDDPVCRTKLSGISRMEALEARTQEGLPRRFDVSLNSFGNIAYVPFSLAAGGGQVNFIPEAEVKQMINLARCAISGNLWPIRHPGSAAASRISRLFTLKYGGTIPFTASKAVAMGEADDWIGANHCQYASTIHVYNVVDAVPRYATSVDGKVYTDPRLSKTEGFSQGNLVWARNAAPGIRDRCRLVEWLESRGLGNCIGPLVAEGFDSMSVLLLLEPEDLELRDPRAAEPGTSNQTDITKEDLKKLLSQVKDLVRERTEMLVKVKGHGRALEFASKDLQADREVVMTAVKRNGMALKWASGDLQADKNLVLAAVIHDAAALRWASEDLQADKEVVLNAVKRKGMSLRWASVELQNDKEVVLAAVQQLGTALRFASKELQADKDMVLDAVQQNGMALKWASEDLQDDEDVVTAAVQQDGSALYYASLRLKNNEMIEKISYSHFLYS